MAGKQPSTPESKASKADGELEDWLRAEVEVAGESPTGAVTK